MLINFDPNIHQTFLGLSCLPLINIVYCPPSMLLCHRATKHALVTTPNGQAHRATGGI